jgi:hypothetical protein
MAALPDAPLAAASSSRLRSRPAKRRSSQSAGRLHSAAGLRAEKNPMWPIRFCPKVRGSIQRHSGCRPDSSACSAATVRRLAIGSSLKERA